MVLIPKSFSVVSGSIEAQEYAFWSGSIDKEHWQCWEHVLSFASNCYIEAVPLIFDLL